MEEKTLTTVYQELVDRFLNGFVFYVPFEIVPENVYQQIEKDVPRYFFNVYHYIVNEDYQNCDIKDFKMKQFEKVAVLENNLFELLRLEKELNETEFKYIIFKYIDLVEFILGISDWFKDHLNLYMKDQADEDAQIVFPVQHHYIATHFTELYKTFGDKYKYVLHKNYSQTEILIKYIPECISRYRKFYEKVSFIEDIELEPETTISKPKIKTQNSKAVSKIKQLKGETEPRVTEEEARKVLLEQVFNVKFND